MKRAAFFIALLLVFAVWLFPHRLVVERLMVRPLNARGWTVELARVRPAWPPGYVLSDVILTTGGFRLTVDRLHAGRLWNGVRRIDARLCHGHLMLDLRKEDAGVDLHGVFEGIDPSTCVESSALTLAGTFDGTIDARGILPARSPGGIPLVSSGRFAVDAAEGRISGDLPGAAGRPELSIGNWAFRDLHLEGMIEPARITLRRTRAEAEGVEWRIDQLTVALAEPIVSSRISGGFRGRRLDESVRSKAMLGLLPKATEQRDGWRRYRISGTAAQPRLVGLR